MLDPAAEGVEEVMVPPVVTVAPVVTVPPVAVTAGQSMPEQEGSITQATRQATPAGTITPAVA